MADLPVSWTENDLARIGDATELLLASRRDDGTVGPYTTMWVVRVSDELYVRSAGGPRRPWYRHALAARKGRVRADGVERDVLFGEARADAHAAIDAAYHAKYDRYGPDPVGHVTGDDANAVTIRLVRSEP